MEPLTYYSETFATVKEALECDALKKLRADNIRKAARLPHKKAVIIYNSDQGEDKSICSEVLGFNDLQIDASHKRHIPIHAIKEIRFI